jgi:cytochrome c-type biogenesis protein CcmH
VKRAGTLLTFALAAVVVWGVATGIGSGPPADRYRALATTLRCPVCQGESVADSPSQSAEAMGREIRSQIESGWSDEQIQQFFVDRYGAWILLDPPRRGSTLLVWALPLVAVTGGVMAMVSRLERSSTRRRWMVAAGGLGAVSIAALVVTGAQQPDERPPLATESTVTNIENLEGVTNESMEEVIAANPAVIGMRLALVERYLDDAAIDDAYRHTSVAINLPATDLEYQRALRLHGWVTALKGAPESGEEYLKAALALSPTDRDALWFLANVQFTGLGDPAAAKLTLEQLLGTEMTAGERSRVEDLLDQVEQAA